MSRRINVEKPFVGRSHKKGGERVRDARDRSAREADRRIAGE